MQSYTAIVAAGDGGGLVTVLVVVVVVVVVVVMYVRESLSAQPVHLRPSCGGHWAH